MMAAHPWLRDEQRHIPLDILIYKLIKSYIRSSPFKRAALKVLIIQEGLAIGLKFHIPCFLEILCLLLYTICFQVVQVLNFFSYHFITGPFQISHRG